MINLVKSITNILLYIILLPFTFIFSLVTFSRYKKEITSSIKLKPHNMNHIINICEKEFYIHSDIILDILENHSDTINKLVDNMEFHPDFENYDNNSKIATAIMNVYNARY